MKVSDSIYRFMEILNKISSVDLTFPVLWIFLSDMVDLNSEFWFEVNENCQEVE